jgi:hypothetical protein
MLLESAARPAALDVALGASCQADRLCAADLRQPLGPQRNLGRSFVHRSRRTNELIDRRQFLEASGVAARFSDGDGTAL